MASAAAKQALQERRQTGDRRRTTSGRRSSDPRLDPQDQIASEQVVAIAAAIILAPRLQALELRDSMPMRNLIQQSVSLAKLVLQRARVELARDVSTPPAR
jgi:hypothetical protein